MKDRIFCPVCGKPWYTFNDECRCRKGNNQVIDRLLRVGQELDGLNPLINIVKDVTKSAGKVTRYVNGKKVD